MIHKPDTFCHLIFQVDTGCSLLLLWGKNGDMMMIGGIFGESFIILKDTTKSLGLFSGQLLRRKKKKKSALVMPKKREALLRVFKARGDLAPVGPQPYLF